MESGQEENNQAPRHRCPECGADVVLELVTHATRFSVVAGESTHRRSRVSGETSTTPGEEAPEQILLSTGIGQSGDDAAVVERWKIADERDDIAESRDRVADKRDEIAEGRDRVAAGSARAAYDRAMAATDRARAADDREKAAFLRIAAADDRAEAIRERNLAGIDQLTGVRLRSIGLDEIEQEIQRARRTTKPLVVAFVDVNNLKAVNDEHGHLAGDVVLRKVADMLRMKLRPYDVIVRFGGDEFVCALGNIDRAATLQRFTDIIATLAENGMPDAISFGLAELEAGDNLELLIKRADEELIAVRRSSSPPPL